MVDGTGLAEKLLGLDGFRVLEVMETGDELTVTVETTATLVGCAECGIRAEAHDRRPVEVRDLACFGRPVRLRVLKRRWRCVEEDCDVKTWTETHPALPPRQVMTHRAGFEAARQVGELARPVSRVADEFGVCWDTVMAAVVAHGTPLVNDPDRVTTPLRKRADGRFEPVAWDAAMADIARLAGVSIKTVSNVLNRPEAVAAATIDSFIPSAS